MKKYLLTVFGQFDYEVVNEIALSFSPVVDSPHLKFQFTPGASIFHFASEVPQVEIHDFICGVLYSVASTFILTEISDKVSVNMPKKHSEHFFNLEEDNNYVVNDEDIDSEEFDDNFVESVLDSIKSKISKPSLDFLLEKIKLQGIGALSPYEKDVLNEYSK
jgi:hypothetical protein